MSTGIRRFRECTASRSSARAGPASKLLLGLTDSMSSSCKRQNSGPDRISTSLSFTSYQVPYVIHRGTTTPPREIALNTQRSHEGTVGSSQMMAKHAIITIAVTQLTTINQRSFSLPYRICASSSWNPDLPPDAPARTFILRTSRMGIPTAASRGSWPRARLRAEYEYVPATSPRDARG